MELGGTRNPAALDAYLHGRQTHLRAETDEQVQVVIAAFTEAIELDRDFALAVANHSLAYSGQAFRSSGPAVRAAFDAARSDAQLALDLAPEAHLALATYLENSAQDFVQAKAEYSRALALAPGSARALRDFSAFAGPMADSGAAIAAARRALILDPLDPSTHGYLASAL